MRKPVEQFDRQADLCGKLLAAGAHRAAPAHVAKAQDRIGNGARGREARIEAVGRVLEHHLDTLAQRQSCELLGRDRADVVAVEFDQPVGRVDQPHHHRGSGRLAATGFAHQPDALAAIDMEADAVDRAEHVRFGRGAAAEELRQRLGHALARVFFDELLDHQKRSWMRRPLPFRGLRHCRRLWCLGILRQQLPQAHPRPRRRAHQLARIGMRRRAENLRGIRRLDHTALFHHDDPVTIDRREPEIVRDQDRRHAALAGELGDQVHHGLLRRHVEAGGRLVGDQELRACRRAPAR